MLVLTHAYLFFDRDALKRTAERAQVSLEDDPAAFTNAVWEWAIWGSYVVSAGVDAACDRNIQLRDAIMDSFYLQLYASLAKSGMKASHLPDLENDIRERLNEYHSALSNFTGGEAVFHLGLAVAKNVLGEATNFMSREAFGQQATILWIEGAKTIKELFRKCKVSL